ncbi:hypothetical protein PVK06_025166 [Gossypium arboreum]|uniref:RNase H type-1 domain-containing protein n=1 Tax=Gossypium arboreum TaxID=29729 RepID=A0ABR0PG31_GOSAR|nr:hypothetical protein PVK06_025166 [Gossypium arboreum]
MLGAETTRFILKYLQDLNNIKRGKIAFSPIIAEWRPPEQGICKINFDAAVEIKMQTSCSGLIVRDWKGEILANKTITHENIPMRFAAKAIVCLQAVILGRDLGLKFVDIEGDCLTVIKKAQNRSKDKSVLNAYIQDIQELCKSFYESKFHYVSREANKKEHDLASKALKMAENTYLIYKLVDERVTEADIDRG